MHCNMSPAEVFILIFEISLRFRCYSKLYNLELLCHILLINCCFLLHIHFVEKADWEEGHGDIVLP